MPLFSSWEHTRCGYPGLSDPKNRSDMCCRWESNPQLPVWTANTLSTRPGASLNSIFRKSCVIYIYTCSHPMSDMTKSHPMSRSWYSPLAVRPSIFTPRLAKNVRQVLIFSTWKREIMYLFIYHKNWNNVESKAVCARWPKIENTWIPHLNLLCLPFGLWMLNIMAQDVLNKFWNLLIFGASRVLIVCLTQGQRVNFLGKMVTQKIHWSGSIMFAIPSVQEALYCTEKPNSVLKIKRGT